MNIQKFAAPNGKDIIAKKLKRLLPQGCNRVLLVNPVHVPEEDYVIDTALDNRYPVYPPYGLGILSADLRRRGYTTDLIDLNYDLQVILKRKEHSFDYNVWRDLLRERMERFNPDVVCVTCMFTITYRQMARTTDFIKEYKVSLPVFAGGVHSSNASELVLRDCENVDFISLFEGNKNFGDILDFVNGKLAEDAIRQIAALIEGQYVAVDERAEKTKVSLNTKPHYHDLPISNYSSVGRIGVFYWLLGEETRASTVLSNVGCRAQCTFCSVRSFNGKGVFTKEIETVVDEIELLRDKYGISHIMWLDDDLFFNESRTIALFEEMVRRRLNITWDASNGIIASATTEEIVHAAAESGCIGLDIGIESGSPEILRSVKKPSGIRHFVRCAEILKKYPQIFVKGLLMCALPDETIGQHLKTVELAKEMLLDWYTIQPLNLIPGVEVTHQALAQGIVTEKEIIDGTERPYVGSTGGQEGREKRERTEALPFSNYLDGDPDRVPLRREIPDIWFVMDYKVNYEKLWQEENRIKLKMLRKMFVNICDRTHRHSATANLYFALVESKLNNLSEARRRLALSKKLTESSDYFRRRFEVLGLYDVVNRIESMVFGPKPQ